MIGYIYRLICSVTSNIYFGSTINPEIRYSKHISKGNTCSSRILINPTMEILEVVDGSINDLKLVEKNYILNNSCVNKNVPTRTPRELYEYKKKNNPSYLKDQYQKYGGKMRNSRTRKKCPCGGVFVQRNQKIHFSTNKHKNYLANL